MVDDHNIIITSSSWYVIAARDKGEHIALLEARKHVNWYLKGVSHVRDFKKRISALEKLSELHALAEEMKAQITD